MFYLSCKRQNVWKLLCVLSSKGLDLEAKVPNPRPRSLSIWPEQKLLKTWHD